jgi:hypothetical protein
MGWNPYVSETIPGHRKKPSPSIAWHGPCFEIIAYQREFYKASNPN